MSVRKHRKIGGRYHWSNCLLFDYEFLLRWMTAGYSSLTKYHDEDSCDCAGNYPSENIEGDNRMLITMVRCAPGHPGENFRYAEEIMSKYIEEHALSAINRTVDFKYICAEYD